MKMKCDNCGSQHIDMQADYAAVKVDKTLSFMVSFKCLDCGTTKTVDLAPEGSMISDADMEKVKNGSKTGFSIGGHTNG